MCNSLTELFFLHGITTYSENYVLNYGRDTEIFVRFVQVSDTPHTTWCLSGLYITCIMWMGQHCNGQGLYSSQSEITSYCCVSSRTKTGYIMTWLATGQMCLLLFSLKAWILCAGTHRTVYSCVPADVANSSMLCVSRPYLLVYQKNEMGGDCSAYGGRGEAYTGFWWGNLREREHLGDPGTDKRVKLRWIFRKWGVGAWTGSIWLRIGTGGRLLWMR